MASKLLFEYESEWTIQTPERPREFKNILTPAFSPLSDNSVSFRFEAWHQRINYDNQPLYLFKLKLVKLSCASVSPTLEMKAEVGVKYYDGSYFREYKLSPFRKVCEMNEVTVGDEVGNFEKTNHSWKLTQRPQKATIFQMTHQPEMTITCKMTFYDQNQTSHFLPGTENTASNTNLDLIRNFKSVYDPAIFSDFTLGVGDKSFPAHKVILSAHSPVFRKMLRNEFMESKNDSVTITDTSPEICGMFLKYLYSGEIEDKSWDSLKALYYLANKYQVEVLENDCADKVSAILSIDLVCDVLEVAYTYSNDRLKEAAVNFAVKHIKELMEREDWKELSKNNPNIGYNVAINFMPR